MQLEFEYLSDVSGNPKYRDMVLKIRDTMDKYKVWEMGSAGCMLRYMPLIMCPCAAGRQAVRSVLWRAVIQRQGDLWRPG